MAYVIAENIADARTTLAQTEERLAASKRYKGRIQDVRWADAVRTAIEDYEARCAQEARAEIEARHAREDEMAANSEDEAGLAAREAEAPHPGERAEAHIEALWNHRALLDFPGVEAGDAERWDAVQEARRIEHPRMAERLRDRVATRAYFLALNGYQGSDEDRWLAAEQAEFIMDAQRRHNYAEVRYHRGHRDPKPVPCTRFAGRDYYDENAYQH